MIVLLVLLCAAGRQLPAHRQVCDFNVWHDVLPVQAVLTDCAIIVIFVVVLLVLLMCCRPPDARTPSGVRF